MYLSHTGGRLQSRHTKELLLPLQRLAEEERCRCVWSEEGADRWLSRPDRPYQLLHYSAHQVLPTFTSLQHLALTGTHFTALSFTALQCTPGITQIHILTALSAAFSTALTSVLSAAFSTALTSGLACVLHLPAHICKCALHAVVSRCCSIQSQFSCRGKHHKSQPQARELVRDRHLFNRLNN